jgi:hypothetical protein
MSVLTAARRNALPAKDFAGPDGSYPVPDASHARDALSRVSANGSEVLKARVRSIVHRKFPGIKQHDEGRAPREK